MRVNGDSRDAYNGIVYELGVTRARLLAAETSVAELRKQAQDERARADRWMKLAVERCEVAVTLRKLDDLLNELWRKNAGSGRLAIFRSYVGEHMFCVEAQEPRGGASGQDRKLVVAIHRAWRLYVCGFTSDQLLAEERDPKAFRGHAAPEEQDG